MYWIISALILGSLVFIWSPQAISSTATFESRLKLNSKLVKSLVSIAIAGCILCLIVTYYSPSPKSYVAIGFALTSVFIAFPKLHRLLLPCAITTGVLLLSTLF
ncbi:hypothetical protein D5018_01990 [Parashewanella curva]|uniref:Uncharacterized protein n=1 Tax=Parashewanella curva TaxID=2338552 RepID=A0A3L8Q1M4_9GAMM|nr:hypothetical protein [Parashewanella curva]RLV61484.1 hypothetical protein D5018_01990 [Parashewanella curva]